MLKIMHKVYRNYKIGRHKYSDFKEILGLNILNKHSKDSVYSKVFRKNVYKNASFLELLLIKFIRKRINFIEKINHHLVPQNIYDFFKQKLVNKNKISITKKKSEEFFSIIVPVSYRKHFLQHVQLSVFNNTKIFLSTEKEIILSMSRVNLLSNGKSKKKHMEIPDSLYNIDENDSIHSPTVKLVNTIINRSVIRRASDIHIEPRESVVSIRIRIDGIMQFLMSISKSEHLSIMSRIKIMSGLNIAEARLPQDGRTSVFINKEKRDIRVATMPSMNGERMVLRLLKSLNDLKNINQLGLSMEHLSELTRNLNEPNGLILVTGPTGSGKTTTLYAALSYVNKTTTNIMTIEDPIEYNLSGINQTQVNNKINLNFANGLRAFLRQDPDILMVGEIRDNETAQIAINASLTGHLVLSTIHTNSSASTITRLINMNIEYFLIKTCVLAIITQRLVRVICSNCKVIHDRSYEDKLWLKRQKYESSDKILWKGKGCYKCYNTGFYGRVGIFEMAKINHDPEVSSKISIIENQTLIYDGIKKVFSGITTISEIMKISRS